MNKYPEEAKRRTISVSIASITAIIVTLSIFGVYQTEDGKFGEGLEWLGLLNF